MLGCVTGKRLPAFTPGLAGRALIRSAAIRQIWELNHHSSSARRPKISIDVIKREKKDQTSQVGIIWEECQSLDIGDLYDTGNDVLRK